MLTMLGVENYIQGVVKGCIIIGAVLIQRGRRQA
jgi:ribose/xylose/arabinose/galactoside ABC-type transport system permease subunit